MINYCEKDKQINGLTALFQVGDAIMDCKTIDAVPVVRCQDCKFFEVDDGFKDGVFCAQHGHSFSVPKPDDFCSYGERKENRG